MVTILASELNEHVRLTKHGRLAKKKMYKRKAAVGNMAESATDRIDAIESSQVGVRSVALTSFTGGR